MNHDKWQWDFVKKVTWKLQSGDIIVKVYSSLIPHATPLTGIGVDPGRNFGIATLNRRVATVYSGTLPKEDKTRKYRYGISAYEMMSNPQRYHGNGPAVVEGAAHKMPHGQADLAHVRMGYVLGLQYAGFPCELEPPSTIRKNALGKGTIGGLEIWPELNHNGADALAVALFAAGIKQEDISGTHLRS